MDLLKKLDLLMKEKKITVSDLSKETGLPLMTIEGFYKNGAEDIKIINLKKIADFFNVSLDFLVDDEVSDKLPICSEKVVYRGSDLISKTQSAVPIFGAIINSQSIHRKENITSYLKLPIELSGEGSAYFGLKMVGDSLNLSHIYDGNIIIARKQNTIENGDIAVVFIGDQGVEVKKLYHTGTNFTLVPNSSNPSYIPHTYNPTADRVTILGKVVKIAELE